MAGCLPSPIKKGSDVYQRKEGGLGGEGGGRVGELLNKMLVCLTLQAAPQHS